jgi:hypothetical protein
MGGSTRAWPTAEGVGNDERKAECFKTAVDIFWGNLFRNTLVQCVANSGKGIFFHMQPGHFTAPFLLNVLSTAKAIAFYLDVCITWDEFSD